MNPSNLARSSIKILLLKLVPPLRRIKMHRIALQDLVAEKDQQINYLMLDQKAQKEIYTNFGLTKNILQHAIIRPPLYVAEFTPITSNSKPPPIINRIASVINKELKLLQKQPQDMWSGFTDKHVEIITLLETDHQKATDYLDKMFTTPLCHGFQQGDLSFKNLSDHESLRTIWAQTQMDKLCGLVEALGCVPVENPEQGNFGELMARDPDELLDLIDQALGFKIKAPPFQAGVYGLKTSRGIFTEREFYSILIAKKIADLITDKSTPICEIGGGNGSLAYYCWQFGFRNITVIDLPTVNIAQTYWLHRNLPDCEIKLSGEEYLFEKTPGIKVLSPRYFELAPSHYFGLVVNVDSFPEISKNVIQGYLKQISQNTQLFLSVNQECAAISGAEKQLIVHEQIKSHTKLRRKYRVPFWLRKGYVEELYAVD